MDSTGPAANPPSPFKHPDGVPFIYFDYFDLAPTFGTMAGTVQIELAARILMPAAAAATDDKIITEYIITAHLRCSPTAALHLREAIDKSLALLAQSQEAPMAVGKLN